MATTSGIPGGTGFGGSDGGTTSTSPGGGGDGGGGGSNGGSTTSSTTTTTSTTTSGVPGSSGDGGIYTGGSTAGGGPYDPTSEDGHTVGTPWTSNPTTIFTNPNTTPPPTTLEDVNGFNPTVVPVRNQMNDTDIVKMIKREVRQMKPVRDSVWNLAFSKNIEYHFFLKAVTIDSVQVIGIKSDSLQDEIEFDEQAFNQTGKKPKGDWHTHQDPISTDRHPNDPEDLKFNLVNNKGQFFCSYVDCGDVIYVVVNEDQNKIRTFGQTKNLTVINGEWATKINSSVLFPNMTRRERGESLLQQLLGLSSASGLGFYKITFDASNNPTINKLN